MKSTLDQRNLELKVVDSRQFCTYQCGNGQRKSSEGQDIEQYCQLAAVLISILKRLVGDGGEKSVR